MSGTVNADSSVYYQTGYWNDLPPVQRYLNRRATGDPDLSWSEHLAGYHGGAFGKALVLNCGNGWVERELVKAGLVAEAVGVDFSADLLGRAREEADRLGLPLRYAELDTNSAQWPEGDFDLVVNYAAGHHIAYLDRVFRSIAEILPPDGTLVSWDYVGPHRNQYPAAQWEAAWELNRSLPDGFGHAEMIYPHLPTMLATDPTEAIHSELILPIMRRYFELDHLRALGGGLAYPVLTFNTRLFAQPRADSDPVVERVLAADGAYTDRDPARRTLFCYAVARPRKASLADVGQLAAWTAEEDERERHAAANGGRYQPDTLLGGLYDALDQARREAEHARQPVAVTDPPDLAAEPTPGLGPEPTAEPTAGPTAGPTGLLARLRAGPRVRAVAARVPGARPAARWLRRRPARR